MQVEESFVVVEHHFFSDFGCLRLSEHVIPDFDDFVVKVKVAITHRKLTKPKPANDLGVFDLNICQHFI